MSVKENKRTRKRVFLLESRLLDLVEQSGWYGGLLSESHNRRVSREYQMEIHQTGMRARVPKWVCIVHQISKQEQIDKKRNHPPSPYRKRNPIYTDIGLFCNSSCQVLWNTTCSNFPLLTNLTLILHLCGCGILSWIWWASDKTTYTSLSWRNRKKGCFSFWLRMFSWYCNKRLTIWPKGPLFEENASSCNCNSSLDALRTLEEKPIKAQIASLFIYMGRKKWSRSL